MMDTEHIRGDFPILEKQVHGKPLVYLDNAATTQKPQAVLDRIHSFYSESNGNIHRGVHSLSEEASGYYEQARRTVAGFINAGDDQEIVFTRGTTESINLVARSFGDAFVGEGDEIIISEMEHHSDIVPWQMLCERSGAKLKILPIEENGELSGERLQLLISDKTRIVSLTWVSHVLGTVNDLQQLIRIAHDREVPVLVDAAQAIQHLPVDVQDLDCDFLAFSGHKIFAETGIGVLYGKRHLLEAMPPYQTGGGMISSVGLYQTGFAGLPLKFEAGTGNFVAAASLASALDYVTNIGIEHIAESEQQVMDYAEERLREHQGVTVYGRPVRRCGVISFNLEGVHPYDAGMILDKMGVAVRTGKLCAEPLMNCYGIDGAVRASFSIYNTRQEVDNLMEGLETVQMMM